MTDPSCTFGALALECSAPFANTTLPRDAAAELAGHVAADLARLLPGVDALDLAVAAAGFDPAELLRPGWPVHVALADLAQRAPGRNGPRVLGFGSHDGAMPAQLTPDPGLRDGPLRLVPFVLHGDEGVVAAIGRQMEDVLLETGMAQAATALFAQEAFAAPLEHARYLSLNDLLAITAMQYEHAGIAPLWPIVEAALLAPGHEEWLDEPPEPLLHWTGSEVRVAMMDISAWLEAGFTPAGVDAGRMSRAYDQFQMRQRQFAAVLGSHGIAVCFDHVGTGQSPRGRVCD
ncbi:hypothetical protein OS187_09785 [Xanthomonadaceae bacterium JHOS43]|nr:hypothetical protein [Xanthomonadaceae bacterium JHOS43]MCX7564074.1 hypothetical protein [Xanthomonadaceae bacterium XH05]